MKIPSNAFCWPETFNLDDPRDRLRAFANWYTLRYGALGPDPETTTAPRQLKTPLECMHLTQFYNRVHGLLLEELLPSMNRDWPTLWSAFLKQDVKGLLGRSSRELMSHLVGSEDLLDEILLFLMRIDLRDKQVEADLTRIREAFPTLVSNWEAMIYTRWEFKWRMTAACFEKFTELLPPGMAHIGMDSTLQLGTAVEEGLWHGMLPVACKDISGSSGAAGWTFPSRKARDQNAQSFSAFYCWDDLIISAGLLAHGADLLVSGGGPLGGLTRDVLQGDSEDREVLAEELFQSYRAEVLDHEVGHHFFNVRRAEEGHSWSNNFYGEMAINEMMAELFALKEYTRRGERDVLLQRFMRVERYMRQRVHLDTSVDHFYNWAHYGTYHVLVLRALFTGNPVAHLEDTVERFQSRLDREESDREYAEWAAGVLQQATGELDGILNF